MNVWSKKKSQDPRPKRSEISYRINPVNYTILAPHEKDQVLRKFVGIIRSIEKAVRITIVNRAVRTDYMGGEHAYMEKSVYISSKEDLGPAIMGTGFRSTRMDVPVRYNAKLEHLDKLDMDDGTTCRAYILYSFPRAIGPAWINDLAAISDRVEIKIRALSPENARRILLSHAHALEAKAGKRYREEAQDARYINDMLQKQETRVYQAGITAMITSADDVNLAKRCKNFESAAKSLHLGVASISGRQKETLDGWGTKYLFEGASMAAFYPFQSADLIESDGAGGVYIGTNELTGTPVIYDYLRRTNYNMVILGASGYGKSMTAKVYIDNFMRMMEQKYADQKVISYILDLHGEYAELAGYMGMDIVDLMGRGEMGLDPFTIMPAPDMAVGLLADVAGMDERMRSIVLARSEGIGSVREMVYRLQHDDTGDAEDCRQAATHFEQFVSGQISKMFSGKAGFGDRVILSLRKADKSKVNSMIISLALLKMWHHVREFKRNVPKIIVIEEAWFLLQMPSTAAILADIARSGRKENVHLIVMTQDVDDVLANEYGNAVVKNAATLLLLGLKPVSASLLKDILDLSENEEREITNLGKGQAIMRADDNRIKVRIRPSEEQFKRFSTTAGGFAP